MKTAVISFIFILINFLDLTAQGKNIKLECNGAYWGQVVLTWTERGQNKKYDSGRGIGGGYKHTVPMAEDASNIIAVVSTDRGFGIYGEGCRKTLGSSGGTFTFGGAIYSESCEWKPDEVGGEVLTTSTANIDEILAGGNTHLHNAVRSGSVVEVNNILKSSTAHMNTRNNKGFAPLHEATQSKNKAVVELLIKNGADIMVKNNQGNTPLYMAVSAGDTELARTFIEAGHPVSNASKEIELAITKRDMSMVKLFLDSQADPNMVCNLALQKNNIEMVELTLNEYGATATVDLFKKALDNRKLDLAERILDQGIEPTQAMQHAMNNKSDDLVGKCLAAGADANIALEYAVTNKKAMLASDALMMYHADPDKYLSTAIKANQLDIVQAMLDNNANKENALTYTLEQPNPAMLDLCLNSGATVQDQHVAIAAKAGHDDDLQKLINAGGSPDVALTSAMDASQFKTAEKMIEQGAKPYNVVKTAVERQQRSLLVAALQAQADPSPGLAPAIQANNTEYAKLLFEAGAQTNDPALVNSALDNNNTQLLRLMIDNGTVVTNGDFMKKVAGNKNSQMVQMLLDAGADANPGLLPAVQANDAGIVQMLLAAGANASPGLLPAVQANNPSIVQMLLDAGADPNPGLLPAVQANNASIVQMLLKAGADGNPGMLPAVQANNPGIVQMLLAAGANGNSSQLLNASVVFNNTQLTELLLTAGADPASAMPDAVSADASKVMELFISKGVDVTDEALLQTAVTGGKINAASVLVKNGADATVVDEAGNNYLHLAARYDNERLIPILAGAGAAVNAQNNAGDSPLHVAISIGRKADDMVEALIAVGADVNLKNNAGKYPLDIAKGIRVKRALKKAGAKKS